MKRILILLICIVSFTQLSAQNKVIDRAGTAIFYSEAPLENIEAKNEKLLGAIDLDKGVLAVSMFMKDFHFDKSLMEEHFNENYIESEKFPKATFTGEIKNFSKNTLTQKGSFSVEAIGAIEIHGVRKPLKTTITFENTDSKMMVASKFILKVADFDIEIPRLMFQNIAEEVEVTALFNFDLNKQ